MSLAFPLLGTATEKLWKGTERIIAQQVANLLIYNNGSSPPPGTISTPPTAAPSCSVAFRYDHRQCMSGAAANVGRNRFIAPFVLRVGWHTSTLVFAMAQ
jgi:hypothetical protein